MKITHGDLIRLATLLEYRNMERGLCAGFQGMLMQAIFAQDKRGFQNRLHFIGQYKENLSLLVEQINKAQQKKGLLTRKEQMLINIPVFFDGITLYQKPMDHWEYFNHSTYQNNIGSIFSLVKPLSLEKNQSKKIFNKAYTFTKSTLIRFLTPPLNRINILSLKKMCVFIRQILN